MTKEQTIKHLKLMQSGVRNAIRFSKNDKRISKEERKEDIEIYQDQLEALDMAIKALEQQPSEDCVSRQVVIDNIDSISEHRGGLLDVRQVVIQLPPVTPTHGTCKDCKNFCCPNGIMPTCKKCFRRVAEDFYCKWFEKRGSENE